MPKHKNTNLLTVARLLAVADECRAAIAAGEMDANSVVYLSVEVCKDGDESTYNNRVHGGDVIEFGVATQLFAGKYVHMQVIGEPNFEVYKP